MEKIFKKSLALILSAALCLTALVGCLTVSATGGGTTTKPVYSVNAVEGAAGAEVEVVASFSEISNVCAHHVIFTFPAGLKVTAVKNAVGEDYVAYDNSGDRFDYKLDTTEDSATKVQFIDFVNWAPENLSTSDMSIRFTVKIDDNAAADTEYPVAIAVQAADYEAVDLLDVTLVNGKVTVKAATTEIPVDSSISCAFGAGLSTTAYLSFVFNNSELTNYSSFELKVTRNTNDNDFNFKEITEVVDGVNPITGGANIIKTASKTYYYYYGIELYSLCVPVTAVLYCKDTEGNIVAKSNPATSTLKDSLIGNYNKTTNDKVKTAIADAIVAAAEVQQFVTLGKTGSDYANLPLPTEGFDTSLATAELGALANYNTPNNTDVVIAPGAAVGAAPYLSFNMANVNSAELGDYNLVISYMDPIYKKEISKTFNLADPSILMSGSKYYAYFYDMAIYATNVEVTAKLYKGEANNLISSYGYSFDTFIEARKSHAIMGSTLIALGKLGQSFRAMNNI